MRLTDFAKNIKSFTYKFISKTPLYLQCPAVRIVFSSRIVPPQGHSVGSLCFLYLDIHILICHGMGASAFCPFTIFVNIDNFIHNGIFAHSFPENGILLF